MFKKIKQKILCEIGKHDFKLKVKVRDEEVCSCGAHRKLNKKREVIKKTTFKPVVF